MLPVLCYAVYCTVLFGCYCTVLLGTSCSMVGVSCAALLLQVGPDRRDPVVSESAIAELRVLLQVQYSTGQHSTVKHSSVQYRAGQRRTAQYG